ncbi:SRPBCC family protein [Paenibacillus qinlingensis]|uniref:Uncharacterized protein YndB with AHSA1/START domain n=1 Tax=Paenibacillus qinlingensis TaxID=1837343 RepID=A0ABU1NYV9_9BACL|nr:SRPBCC family protein [Paenibacillus qinlingensis]MDR6552665.1 uncharacterized protein YndB with AHSA1/START domain [Paenibacillus qinlingensis]
MIEHEAILTYEPGGQQICMTRVFNAPRELVFKAFTDAKLFAEWLGPRQLTMQLVTFEPWSGGSWRYIHKDSHGNEFAFRGVYHEVAAPERIIQTFEFEGLPEKGHVILETARFEALDGGQTKLVMESVFQSVADRDGMLHSGMEQGMQDSYERLADLLERMK